MILHITQGWRASGCVPQSGMPRGGRAEQGAGPPFDLVCHERLLGKSSEGHVARSRFIPIQRTIIVDLALPGKARVNRGLINQL